MSASGGPEKRSIVNERLETYSISEGHVTEVDELGSRSTATAGKRISEVHRRRIKGRNDLVPE
jgi:hypothetical protein